MADFNAGFTRPDIGPGAAFIAAVLNQNQANERADQYANMERTAMVNSELRQSHEDKRKEEDEKHRRAVEAFAQLPALQRMAMKSIGMANANPYGVKIEEQAAPPPSIGNVDIMKAAGNSYGLHAADVLANPPAPAQAPTLEPGQEGPEVSPELEAQRFAPPEQPPMLGPEPPTGIEEAQSVLAQPAKKTLFANVAGQRFELPQTSGHSPFGPEYDALYQGLLEDGSTEAEARKYIAAQYKNDQAEKGRAGRLADTLDERDKAREDQQKFLQGENEKYRNEGLDFEQRKKLVELANQGRIGAARATQLNPLKVDTANRQDMGTLRQGFKEWKNTVNLAIDSKSHKRLATAMANLNSGNAMQQREAAESLVSIFKGGGQVTKASQDLLLHNLAGIVGDAQTYLSKMESGHYGERELNVLKQATQNALIEEREKLNAYHESAVDTFGPGSGYEQLGGNVNAMIKGAFKQFGYDAPDIYQNAPEAVVLGSGKRPKSPASAKPQTVTIQNKKTGETKEVSLEEARKLGAAP